MHVFLETERLRLRRFTLDDVDLIVALDGDPEVMRYISGGKPTSREAIETDYLPAWLSYYERSPDFGFWAAEEKSSGEFIGWFHFRSPPDHAPEDVELGYRLRRSAWGKGVRDGGLARVDRQRFFPARRRARLRDDHDGQQCVASRNGKAGLKFERIVHRDWPMYVEGDEHGETEYALTLDEWRERIWR